jgi:hypothetical protein
MLGVHHAKLETKIQIRGTDINLHNETVIEKAQKVKELLQKHETNI